MFKARYLLLLLALGTVGAVGFVLHKNSTRTAASLLAAANTRLEEEVPDFDSVLRELDRALELAVADDDRELAQEIFITRARTYRRTKVLDKAREDFETVLDEYMPGSPSVTLQVGWIDYELKNWNAALASASAVLKEMPTHSEGNLMRGRTLHRMGEIALDEVHLVVEAELADEDAAQALELAWHAATLDRDHPHRSATLSELDELFGNVDTTEVRGFIDAATSCLTQARSSYVASLDGYKNPVAMVYLIVLLNQGNRWNDVVNFGVAAAAHVQVQSNIRALEAMVSALDELDRPSFASAILSQVGEEEVTMPTELLATWCRLLYESENWRRLERVGRSTKTSAGREGHNFKATATFFTGWAKLNLQKYDAAQTEFQSYVNNPPDVEPIPNARGLAYYGLAQVWRKKNDIGAELRFLEKACAAAPDLSAEMWRRTSEVQIERHHPFSTAAESLTHALGLDLSTHAELIPLWEELSLRAMDENRRTIEGVKRQARKEDRWVLDNDPKAVTFEFYAIGREYLSVGHAWAALQAGRAILDRYPGHVLGLDLVIEAEAMRGSWMKVVDLLIQRARTVGPHPDTLSFVAEIPPGMLEAEESLTLMELDPKVTGLSRMVETLRQEGRNTLAITGLRSIPPEDLNPDMMLLMARLLAEEELWKPAMEAAALIPSTSEHYAEALEISLQGALALRRQSVIPDLLRPFLEHASEADLDVEGTRRVAHWLLAHDEPFSAAELLEHLDRPESRTGAGLLSLAIAYLESGELLLAEDTLDRAEPLLTGPEASIARIIFLSRTGRWTEVPGEVELLGQGGVTPTPWVRASLLGLSERVRETAAAAEKALDEGAEEPAWLLVLEAADALLTDEERTRSELDPYPAQTTAFVGGAETDPRNTWVYLLALETDFGAAWANNDLTRLKSDQGRLWALWLRTKALDRLGYRSRANLLCETIVRGSPAFVPGWDRLQADVLAEIKTELHPEFTSFLERRLTALGPDEDRPTWTGIVRAQRMARQGSIDQAIDFVTRTQDALSENPLGLISAARLLKLAGRRGEAVLAFGTALAEIEPWEAALLVQEFVELGSQAFLERTLSAAAWRGQLQALLTELPDNPRLSLAWARLERVTATDPVQGWSRARAEYERFRDATDWRSLDDLQPGSAAVWAEFFLRENPREAEFMIRDELPRSPGSPDLWRLLAESLEIQGKTDEAFDRYIALINILPEPETMRLAAEILAQRGSDHQRLEITLSHIQQVERERGPDPELELLRSRSLTNSGMDGVERALPLYEKLWTVREQILNPSARIELSIGYAVAMLHRGEVADAPTITAVLKEVIPFVKDPYRRDMVQAYLHLAKWMPGPVPDPGPDEDEEQS